MTNKAIATSILFIFLAAIGQPKDANGATLAAGNQHSVVVTPDGRVWTWGSNSFGQLGDGTTIAHKVPVAVPSLTGITAVAAGLNFTLALKSDGTLWAWGYNVYGQLGDNTTTQRLQPIQLPSLSGVIAIAAGDNHSVALTSDGYVWVWGQNNSGQLGDGTTTISKLPKQVATAPAVAIAAGSSHTLIVKTDGTVWGMGANATGQLGDGTSTNPRKTPVQMTGVSSAIGVAGGNAHSLVLLTDGSLKASGSNNWGQLGDSSNTQRTTAVVVTGLSGVQSIAASQAHSFAVRADGTVWSWGFDALGAGATTQRNVPGEVAGLSGVATVAAGQSHGMAVSTTGVVWTWGDNAGGQLGDGTTVDESVPLAISDTNYAWKIATPTFSVAGGTYNTTKTVAVSSATPGAEIHYTLNGSSPSTSDASILSGSTLLIDKTVTLQARAWLTGSPASNAAVADYVLTPVKPTMSPNGGTFTSPQSVTLSTTTSGSTIRYTLDGTTPSESSALYQGSITVSTSTNLMAVAFRQDWTPSISATATFHMNFGTLPTPTISPAPGAYSSAVVVTMTSTDGATIRYTTNGTTPTTTSSLYTGPVSVSVTSTVSVKAFHPDYNPSPTATGVYTILVEAPSLSPGGGTYSYGQVVTATSPTPGATITYTLNGIAPAATDPVFPSTGVVAGNFTLKLVAWKSGATPSPVASAAYQVTGTTRSGQIYAGGTHSLAMRPDGVVLAWGGNGSGQLGDGTTISRSTPVIVNGISGAHLGAAGDSHSLGILSSASSVGWGANGSGRLGDNTVTNRLIPTPVLSLQNVSTVSAGFLHSLALAQDGTVWAWGNNASGQLGVPDPAQQLVPIHIPTLTDIVGVATRESSSFALATDGSVWSWGANANGQLASGDTTGRSTPSLVSGLSNVQAIAAGGSHTLALIGDGTVRAWGLNTSGQVGDGTFTQRTVPVSIGSLTGVIAVAAGGSHSLALRQDGTVWAWGANSSGQLGDGSGVIRSAPVAVIGLPLVSRISAGKNHSLALGDDGSIWAWGRNLERQLGDGTTTNALAPVCIVPAGALAPSVSEPVFTPTGGEYVGSVQVSITSSTAQSSIRWTSNNSLPTESSLLYTSPINIPAGTTSTLRARAFRSGWAASETAIATFTALLGTAPTPIATPSSGSVDAYVAVKLTVSDAFATIRFTTDGTIPTETSRLSLSYSALILRETTTLKARAFRAGYAPSEVMTAEYQLSATPTHIALNATPDSEVLCVVPGTTITTTVTNGAGGAGDWLGLYPAGSPNNEYLDWLYLNGIQDRPASGLTSAVVEFLAPSQPGEYDVRFCHDERSDCSRKQATFMVAQSGMCVAISAPHPGTTTMLSPSISLQTKAVSVSHTIDQVQLLDGDTLIGAALASPYTVAWDDPVAGVHSLTASATATSGGTVTGAPILFNVTDAHVVVDGAVPPARVVVTPGTPLSVSAISGMAFGPTVSLGIYRVEDGDANPMLWSYMNGTHNVPLSDSTNPTISLQAPSLPGVYQVRLCLNGGPRCSVASSLILIDASLDLPPVGASEPMLLAWPTPGMYGPFQMISLIASANSSIRFTLDGTTPDAASPLYTVPFQITRPVQVRARAFPSGGGAASDMLVAEYSVDNTLPFITPTLTPTANALGWNRTDVTLSFSCSDDQSGVAACPDPITIDHDTGGEIVAVQSRDVVGNVGELTLTVRVDRLAPFVTVTSPSAGTTVSESTVLLRGTAIDGLAGVESVTCNGVGATVAGGAFHCIVPLSGGGNEINVVALDRAGNATPVVHTVYRTVTPVIISLQPDWGHVGQIVLIHGTNFGSNGAVTVNGHSATLIDWSDTVVTVEIPSGATTGPTVLTTAAGTSGGVTFTVTIGQPPTITSVLSPSAAMGGWYSTDVTVSFTCGSQDSTVTSCTGPHTVTDEGEDNKVVGEAVDAEGNRTSLSVLVKVDKTAPMLSIRNPQNESALPSNTTEVVVTGSVSDGGSGLQSVTCAGSVAALDGQSLSCTVSLLAGDNSIELVARDVVGHETHRTLSIFVGDVPPSSLEISPSQMTMTVGETRRLNLADERGRLFTGATWSVDHAEVVHITVTAESVTIEALTPGGATLTVEKDGLSATAQIVVLGAGVAPQVGTTVWALAPRVSEVAPSFGKVLRAAIPEGADESNTAALFFVARYDLRTEIRATTFEGRQLWTYTHNEPAGTVTTQDDAVLDPFCCFRGMRGTLKHVAADEYGGLILVQTQHWTPATGNWWRTSDSAVVRLNGSTGAVDWEYQVPDSQLSDAAIRDDGTIFVVVTRRNATELIGLDGNNGTVKYQINLGYSEQSVFTKAPANATAPTILEDDTVLVGVHRFIQRGFDRSNTFHVVGLTGNDLSVDRAIWIDGIDPAFLFPDLERLIPDNKGGLLLATVGMVFRVGPDNVLSNPLELRINEAPYFPDDVEYVVADDAVNAMIHHQPTVYNPWEGARLVTFDPLTLTEMGSEVLTGSPRPHVDFSLEGGGVSWSWDASNATQVGPQLSSGWQPNPVIQVSEPVSLGEASWRFAHGNVQESNKVKGLHSNYNAVDVFTNATADEVFTTLITTYYGVNASTQGTVTGVPVTGVGQTLTFTLPFPLSVGQGPFSVETVRYDPSEHVIAVRTAENHPLAGWRFWHVFFPSTDPASSTLMRIETGALDHPAPDWTGFKNQLGFWLTKSKQLVIWEEYMRKIVDRMQQTWSTVTANNEWIVGKWDVFPKEYIRTQICGPYPYSPAPLLCGPQ